MGSLDSTSNGVAGPSKTIDLPIVDISKFDLDTGKATLAAAVKYGFLYIVTSSTRFTKQIVDRQFALAEELFAQPLAEKEKYHISEDNRGWTGGKSSLLQKS